MLHFLATPCVYNASVASWDRGVDRKRSSCFLCDSEFDILKNPLIRFLPVGSMRSSTPLSCLCVKYGADAGRRLSYRIMKTTFLFVYGFNRWDITCSSESCRGAGGLFVVVVDRTRLAVSPAASLYAKGLRENICSFILKRPERLFLPNPWFIFYFILPLWDLLQNKTQNKT